MLVSFSAQAHSFSSRLVGYFDFALGQGCISQRKTGDRKIPKLVGRFDNLIFLVC